MDMTEFRAKAKFDETGIMETVLDVRVFGAQQRDAIDYYLQARLKGSELLTSKPLVIRYDELLDEHKNRAKRDKWNEWKNDLKKLGQDVELTSSWSPTL
jgi:hypothetical protein